MRMKALLLAASIVVAPADHGGVAYDFGVKTRTAAALVRFVDAAGRDLPPGAGGALNDGAAFTIGYDGVAYLQDLRASNVVAVTMAAGRCEARFEAAPATGAQAKIGPVICREPDAGAPGPVALSTPSALR